MKQLTEILPDVFIVEAQSDAQYFVVDMGYLIFKIMDTEGWITDDEMEEDAIRFLTTGRSKFSNLKEKSMWKTTGIPLPEGEWQYLGTCTKDEISFDAEPYLQLDEEYSGKKLYKCDLTEYGVRTFATSDINKAFRSLLLKNNLYWENPFRKPSIEDLWGIDTGYEEGLQQWQQYESNRLTGKLVVLKKVK